MSVCAATAAVGFSVKETFVPVIGAIVESVSGGDSGKFYLIVGIESNGYVLLVDGKRHKLDKPKRKNPKHVKLSGNSVKILPKTDASVVTAIRRNKT